MKRWFSGLWKGTWQVMRAQWVRSSYGGEHLLLVISSKLHFGFPGLGICPAGKSHTHVFNEGLRHCVWFPLKPVCHVKPLKIHAQGQDHLDYPRVVFSHHLSGEDPLHTLRELLHLLRACEWPSLGPIPFWVSASSSGYLWMAWQHPKNNTRAQHGRLSLKSEIRALYCLTKARHTKLPKAMVNV